MSIEQQLLARSDSKCELCAATSDLAVYAIPPQADGDGADQAVLLCATCREQVERPDSINANHWHCLNDSMWSQVPAVQVMAWRMLTRLRGEGWPQELLDMLFFDEETLAWAQADGDGAASDNNVVIHKDSFGAQLVMGDTVTLIKDLNVKGANFTAKRGSAVRNISLVADHEGQIEGRVNGQQIVILTQFVKKSG